MLTQHLGGDCAVERTVDEPQACPVCEATNLELDVYGFDGLCRDCGFVLQEADTEPVLPDWAADTESTVPAAHSSWEDHCRVTNATEAQLADAFGLIEDFSDQLPLPADLRVATAETYGSAFRAELTDGRATADMIAACLRVGSVQADTPLPTGRLTELESVSETTFRSCCRDLQTEVDIVVTAVSPATYLWIFESELAVDEAMSNTTRDFLESIGEESLLVGKNPAGIAAAGLYWTVDDITQQDAAAVAGVTTETIRLRVTDFEEIVT